MPLYNETHANPAAPAIDPVRVEHQEIKSIVTDTRYEPTRNLLKFIEGSSWITLYYSQILNSDSALSGQQVDLNAVNQQYTLIKNFELKVTRAIESTQDDQTGNQTVTGAANLYPGVIPNVGDMFIGDCGDGRNGIFRVTVSNRKTIFKDTCYEIEYVQVAINDPIRSGDLNQKVVRTFEFVKDYLSYGRTPIVRESEYITLQKLNDHYNYLVDYYFNKFHSNDIRLLILPGQDGRRVHDVYASRFVLNLLDTFKSNKVRYTRRLNIDEDECLKLPSIWDALAKRDYRLAKTCFREYSLVRSSCFTSQPRIEGIFYSGTDYLVYPNNQDLPVDVEEIEVKPSSGQTILNKKTIVKNLDDLVTVDELKGLFTVDLPRMIPEINSKDYVLSKEFYRCEENKISYFELLILKYLRNQKVEFDQLELFCRASLNWNVVEQYYYIPIILLLIRSATLQIAY